MRKRWKLISIKTSNPGLELADQCKKIVPYALSQDEKGYDDDGNDDCHGRLSLPIINFVLIP